MAPLTRIHYILHLNCQWKIMNCWTWVLLFHLFICESISSCLSVTVLFQRAKIISELSWGLHYIYHFKMTAYLYTIPHALHFWDFSMLFYDSFPPSVFLGGIVTNFSFLFYNLQIRLWILYKQLPILWLL